ncbi:MAG: flagellar assembly protein FliW [Planctomycetota bacterium]|nr:flagellar assembly protein FliW [Planctomycetota bacterium]
MGVKVKIETTRFGTVEIEKQDILDFESGLIGFGDSRKWVILADTENPAVAWLQSLVDPSLAMAVVSPRRFIPNYQVRLTPSELEPIHLTNVDQAFVLCVVSRNDNRLTMNLRAPVIINLDRKMGAQIMTSDDQPLQYPFANLSTNLRQSA